MIEADGRGYYEFLPATFIYKDLQLNYLDTLHSEFYDHNLMANDFYKRLPNGKRFDKYFIGTAVLQLPFFLAGHAYAKTSDKYAADGFSKPYQTSIYVAAIFYAFLGLVFLRLLLSTYEINRFWILFLQLSVICCTSLLYYTRWDVAYSHVYSFFLVSGFLYFARNFMLRSTARSLTWTIIFLGLIFLVRPVNVLIVLFIPIISNNNRDLLNAIKSLFTNKLKTTIISVVIVLLIYQIQCLVWYFQIGHWFYYSYGEETFNWSEPHIIDFLFSYRKGFFLWSPWFFVLVACAFVFHLSRKLWLRLIWFSAAFFALIYVLSCWWYWSYGGSLGSRPMIDFYPALIVFAAPAFAKGSGIFKWIVLLLTPVFAYVMIRQTYQYQKGILNYDEMTKQSYWRVFMETDPMYEYYLWGRPINLGKKVIDTNWEKHREMVPDRWYVFDTLEISNPVKNEIGIGQITFLTPRHSGGESLEIRLLDENNALLFNHYKTLLHVIDESKGNQFADYRFVIRQRFPEKIKAVFVINTKTSAVTIDSMKIRFFTE